MLSDIIPEESINRPISKDDILKQLSKTGNTEFEFINLDIELDENIFIPKISSLNELRRNCLENLEKQVLSKYSHNLILKGSNISNNALAHINHIQNTKNISVLFNTLNLNYDYSSLKNIDNIYIPLRLFMKNDYKELINDLSKKFSLYIYMPHILEDKNLEKSQITLKNYLTDIIKNFDIKGFVVSHISQINLLKEFNLKLIGNFNLNIYNNYSIKSLDDFSLEKIVLSPELSEEDFLNILNSYNFSYEILAYGKLPLMTNHYCYLGKSNKCHKSCDKKCMLNQAYYLKDRKGFCFRIIPDNTSCITTIYHNKPICMNSELLTNVSNIRLDFLDEDFNFIQETINKFYND